MMKLPKYPPSEQMGAVEIDEKQRFLEWSIDDPVSQVASVAKVGSNLYECVQQATAWGIKEFEVELIDLILAEIWHSFVPPRNQRPRLDPGEFKQTFERIRAALPKLSHESDEEAYYESLGQTELAFEMVAEVVMRMDEVDWPVAEETRVGLSAIVLTAKQLLDQAVRQPGAFGVPPWEKNSE